MWASASVLAAIAGLAAQAESRTVQTQNGALQGGTCNSTEVDYFFSIPYAQKPLGERRFAPPEPYTAPSTSVLNATGVPPACIQFGGDFHIESGPQSEDCLYINVWAPSYAKPNTSLPVKVWLYGGDNQGGGIANPTYDGCYSAIDSIVVSMNYRLGPMGFLALQDLGFSGNYGILDQILGLNWVQDNIAAFGGDPDKVLLFGESAGAIDAYLLASLPEAPQWMRATALESGAGRTYSTVAEAQVWQTRFVEALNCTSSDESCVRNASSAAIQLAAKAIDDSPYIGTITPLSFNGSRSAWGPLIDGAVLPAQPLRAGLSVPAIIGGNAAEGTLFVIAAYEYASFNLTAAFYADFLAYNYGPLAPNVSAAYALDRFNGSVFTAMETVITEGSFQCASYRALRRAEEKGVPVWTYHFNHQPSCSWYNSLDPSLLKYVGATHTSEIPFVFNFTTGLPPPVGNCAFTDAEVAISREMSRAWTDMAEFGAPANETQWPVWTSSNSLGVAIKNGVDVATVDYSSCVFWDAIYSELDQAQ